MLEYTMQRLIKTTEDVINNTKPKYEIVDENNVQSYIITDTLNIRKDSLEHFSVIGHFCLYLHNVHQRCINVYEIQGMAYILNNDLNGCAE